MHVYTTSWNDKPHTPRTYDKRETSLLRTCLERTSEMLGKIRKCCRQCWSNIVWKVSLKQRLRAVAGRVFIFCMICAYLTTRIHLSCNLEIPWRLGIHNPISRCFQSPIYLAKLLHLCSTPCFPLLLALVYTHWFTQGQHPTFWNFIPSIPSIQNLLFFAFDLL